MGVVEELRNVAGALASGAYPAFVVHGELRQEIPAFFYHQVDPAQMEDHFRHLSRNGYRSLDAGEHLVQLEAGGDPGRCVVVTFDDGLADLYELAFPLLQRFGIKAVAFVIPGRVGEAGLANWRQIREMHESGLVDVQSHSMHHVSIPISGDIEDFVRPGYVVHRSWDLPVGSSWPSCATPFPPAWGTPIPPHVSRLADPRRFVAAREFTDRCIEVADRLGGKRFFAQSDWRRQLEDAVDPTSWADKGRLEGVEEQVKAIRTELTESKQRIEAELPGKTVAHLAYPWHQMGEVTLRLLPQCGYRSAYAGLTPHKGPGSVAGRYFELARVNADFIPCLPGEGRRSAWSVLAAKVKRRLTRGQPY